MQPNPRYTVIMTQRLKARDLAGPSGYGPTFIDDDSPQQGLDGKPAYFARKVDVVHDHIRSAPGDRDQVTVEFADGTPGRIFDLDDDVVVYNILPGSDLTGA